MSTATVPVTFRTTCSWCILYRPGCAPNYITVPTLRSNGICAECSVLFKARK